MQTDNPARPVRICSGASPAAIVAMQRAAASDPELLIWIKISFARAV
jgi:hypothetical protein